MIKDFLRDLPLRLNIRLSKPTDEKTLFTFFKLVRPFTTSIDLIRVGGSGDGGYLIPNDLDGIKSCFSPGVSTVANFEQELTEFGIHCFLADYSVEAPPFQNSLFNFEKKYLGDCDDDIYMRLDSWVLQKSPVDHDMILQMDIEGAEYRVIDDTSEEILKKFRIIIIEFHGLESLLDPIGHQFILKSFKKLLKYFEIVHIHPNNFCGSIKSKNYEIPKVMEFTFLRKDRIKNKKPATSFPQPLDQKNVNELKDIILPKCWYLH